MSTIGRGDSEVSIDPTPPQSIIPLTPTPTITSSVTPSVTSSVIPSVTPSITPLITPSITPSITSSVEIIYVESDDTNPLHVHYENNSASIVNEDDVEKIKRDFKPKKTYLRDVRSSKRRHI